MDFLPSSSQLLLKATDLVCNTQNRIGNCHTCIRKCGYQPPSVKPLADVVVGAARPVGLLPPSVNPVEAPAVVPPKINSNLIFQFL